MSFQEATIFTLYCACKISTFDVSLLITLLSNEILKTPINRSNFKEIYEKCNTENITINDFASLLFNKKFNFDEIKNWPESFGPKLWLWIHYTTKKLDMKHLPYKTRVQYILLIESVIWCVICKTHYTSQIPHLIKVNQTVPLYKLFMAFHTFISTVKRKYSPEDFIYNETLIDSRFTHYIE